MLFLSWFFFFFFSYVLLVTSQNFNNYNLGHINNYRGETVPGGQSLLHDMPQSVREDVSMEECADLLNNIPFFKHVDNSFLREVSLTTSVYLFAPGDMILYSGDMGREMYCIRKGYVEVSLLHVQKPSCMYLSLLNTNMLT